MNKFFKIYKFLFLLFFLYSCGSVGDALQGKKRSDQGDEFLIDKKNPLAMPPDFDKLPVPGDKIAKSTKDIENDQSNIENLLKKSADEQENESNQSSSSIENSILKKIK
tara:strand:- start:51 stop:377 length:327 start_codon:yes stop_codon:yes gene_type:complete